MSSTHVVFTTVQINLCVLCGFSFVQTEINEKGPLKNPDHFNYADETAHAYQNGTLAATTLKEIEKIKTADLIVIQTPMNWFSVPAILKGWFDKVFISGFAHKFPNVFDKGLMKGKKIILSITTGGPGSFYTTNGLSGDINVILWPILYGTFAFCGFDVLKPQVSYVGFASEVQRREMLESWATRIGSLDKENPMKFIPMENFNPQSGFTLNSEFIENLKENEFAPTFGHHMGKKIRQ